MQITEVKDRNESLINELVDVWERSVKATHLFLSAAEIAQIKTYVPQALGGVAHLMVGELNGKPVAFMGIEENKIEMLFIAPEQRGKGLGRQLVEYAFAKSRIHRRTPFTSVWALQFTSALRLTNRASPTRCYICAARKNKNAVYKKEKAITILKLGQ